MARCTAPNNTYQQEQIGTTRFQYDAVVRQIKNSGADSIVALLEPTNQSALLQALAAQHMTPADGFAQYAPLGMDPSSISAGGAAAGGVLVNTADSYFPSENTPGIQQLAAALHRYQPDTPVDNYSLSIGWTPMVVFGEALRRCGAKHQPAVPDQCAQHDVGVRHPRSQSPFDLDGRKSPGAAVHALGNRQRTDLLQRDHRLDRPERQPHAMRAAKRSLRTVQPN